MNDALLSHIPEHEKRMQANGLHPDVEAAYNYVSDVSHTADFASRAWRGWALREAFLAGISYCQQRSKDVEP